jgi:hypothetical protein
VALFSAVIRYCGGSGPGKRHRGFVGGTSALGTAVRGRYLISGGIVSITPVRFPTIAHGPLLGAMHRKLIR